MGQPMTVVTCEFPPPYDEAVAEPEEMNMTPMKHTP